MAVGPDTEEPSASAHGKADLALYLDGGTGDITMTVTAAWWTSDGQCREASLSLSGDSDDGYDLISEATQWVWKRWKKPLAQNAVGPFDVRSQ